MTTHTPGPWKVLRSFPRRLPFGIAQDVDDPMKCKGVLTTHAFCRKTTDETEANARLIAAAPELLTALENALDYLPITSEEFTAAMDAVHKAKGNS